MREHEHTCAFCQQPFRCDRPHDPPPRFGLHKKCARNMTKWKAPEQFVGGDVAILVQTCGAFGGPPAVDVLAAALRAEMRAGIRRIIAELPAVAARPEKDLWRAFQQACRATVEERYREEMKSGASWRVAAKRALALWPRPWPVTFPTPAALKQAAHRSGNKKRRSR